MKEYIEREATKQLIESKMTKIAAKSGDARSHIIQGYMLGKAHAKDWVDQIPTADVVEVVRCRECKHFMSNYCTHDLAMNYCCGNDFCSYGARKEQT